MNMNFAALLLIGATMKSCGGPVVVPVPPPPIVNPMVDCEWLVGSRAEGEPADCALVVSQFERAKDLFSTLGLTYARAAAATSIDEYNLYRPERLHVPGRSVPVIQLGDRSVQGYIGPSNFIAYGHEYVIFCESLHYMMWKLDPAGDEWQNIGHDNEFDPLHFPCWQVIENNWEMANQ